MSITDIGKAYFFSPVKALLTKDGLPIANARVIRRWELDELLEDETVTDSEGVFSLPEVRGRALVQILPAEFVVAQQIVVELDGEEVEIWSNSKRRTEMNSELGGKPLDLRCDIADEEALYRDFGAALITKCTWK